MIFTQCLLSQENRRQMSWIPSSFAKVGNVLKLRNLQGTWEDGWKVNEIFLEKEESQVKEHSQFARNSMYVSDLK